jgi:hypothetical protein
MTNDEGMTNREIAIDHEVRFWNDGLSVVREEPRHERAYDLEERTARFGEAVIDFAKTIPQDPEERSMIFVIRASSFLRPSSFVIRHFSP